MNIWRIIQRLSGFDGFKKVASMNIWRAIQRPSDFDGIKEDSKPLPSKEGVEEAGMVHWDPLEIKKKQAMQRFIARTLLIPWTGGFLVGIGFYILTKDATILVFVSATSYLIARAMAYFR